MANILHKIAHWVKFHLPTPTPTPTPTPSPTVTPTQSFGATQPPSTPPVTSVPPNSSLPPISTPIIPTVTPSVTPLSMDTILYDGFESYSTVVWKTQTANPDNIQSVDSVIPRSGARALRLICNKVEKFVAGGSRSEIFRPNDTVYWVEDTDIWVGASILFPYEYIDDPTVEIVWQVHPVAGTGSPVFYIQSIDGNIIIKGKGFSDLTIPKTKGLWMDIVAHHKFSPTNGITEVFVNTAQVINSINVPNMFVDMELYVKFGMYKTGWKQPGSNTETRTVYFDEIRFGNSYAGAAPI